MKGINEYCHCELGKIAMAQDEERRQKLFIQKLATYGVPERYAQARIKMVREAMQLPGNDNLKKIVGLVDDKQSARSVYLYGAPGAGKATAISALFNWMLWRQPRTARWINYLDLVAQIQTGYQAGKTRELLDEICSVELLCMVRFGGTPDVDPTPDQCEKTKLIVALRHDRMLPTVISSQLSPDDLAEKFGPDIRRWVQKTFLVISVEGGDYWETQED